MIPKTTFRLGFLCQYSLVGLRISPHARSFQTILQDDFVPAFNRSATDEIIFFLICRIINVIYIVENMTAQVDRASIWFLVFAAIQFLQYRIILAFP